VYKKILVPLDGSEQAECVLTHVKNIAADCPIESVIFLQVVKPTSFLSIASRIDPDVEPKDYQRMSDKIEDIEKQRIIHARKYLSDVINRLDLGNIACKLEVVVGKVARTIVQYSEDNGIHMIMLAAHGQSGNHRWSIGSIADKVMRISSAPVLLIRHSREKSIS